MKRMIAFVNVAFFLAIPALLQAQSEVGVWKQNMAKSKTIGVPAKSRTFTIQAHEGGIMFHAEGVRGDGSPFNNSFVAKYDGKDYPFTGTGPNGADSIALRRIDANTAEATYKKGGKVVFTARHSISQDGKVMTERTKAISPDGKPTRGRAVFEKQ